ESPYLKSALRLGRWIHENCFSPGLPGGYTGGVEGWEGRHRRVGWKSTEHNIDIYVAFSLLRSATGDAAWGPRAAHARQFVERMWDEAGGHFWTGTEPDGKDINRNPIPLDLHAWAILALPETRPFRRAAAWATANCWVERCPTDGKSRGFDFNTDRDGIWWE